MALNIDPFDEDEIEMCSDCLEDEEYDYGLCIGCYEATLEEV